MLRVIIMSAALALGACAQEAASPNPAADDSRSMLAVLETPTSGARTPSPLHVAGQAPNDWFFEAQFPITIVGANGALLAEAPARPQTDWHIPGPVLFEADLNFTVRTETQATLVLQEDMPGDGQTPREVRLPIVLLPTN